MTEAVNLHRPAARTITEFFGPMVRHLRRNVDAPAYAETIELFQNLVERNVPVGPGDRFVLPVDRRQLHSVRSAAIEYSLDKQRVRKLLEERGITSHSKLSDRRVCFAVEDGENILGAATENMTTIEAAVALGTTDNRVHDIIARGLLKVSERGVEANRPYYRVGKADLDDFRSRLFSRR
ncbi:hypothetical protein LP421_15940 [Rhizobium sp. RCAM05350]|nr:hypothetical protein LP421_15940 [Rhizobium sp. RCAM05350]